MTNSDRKSQVSYLIFDIETIADRELVAKIRYPNEELTPAEALARYRTQLLAETGKDVLPITFVLPISVAVAKVDAEFRLLDVAVLDAPKFRPHVIVRHFWQGWNAYGERFGSNLAYNGIRQTVTYGTSIVFHEDNRYFASHKNGFWARTGYAALSTVVAQHPDGRRVFSVSSVTGIVAASAISSIWGPSSFKGVDNIAANAGLSLITTAGFNIVREFLPDVLHRHRK